ncbi:MAG: hypothetical protein RR336_10960, partial [Oscillospiraceae bacterium]
GTASVLRLRYVRKQVLFRGHSYTEPIPATGAHNYVDATTPATCTAVGSITHICSLCSDALPPTEIPALGHNYVDKITPATCFEGGFTSHICSLCSDAKPNTDPTAATGVHVFGPWTDAGDGANHKHSCTTPGCTASETAPHSPWNPGDTCTDCKAKKPPTAILTQLSPFEPAGVLGTFTTVYTIAWTGTPGAITATYTVDGGAPAAAVADELGITTSVSVPVNTAGSYTVVITLYSDGTEIAGVTVTLSVDANNFPSTGP